MKPFIVNKYIVEYLPNETMLQEVMSLENKPDGPKEREDFSVFGYSGPGWYFWDKPWVSARGPFKLKDEVIAAVHVYAGELNEKE